MNGETAHRISRAAAGGIVAAAECYVLAEILWTVLAPSGPRLYELAWTRIQSFREQREYNAAVMSTLAMIRRLPEYDPE